MVSPLEKYDKDNESRWEVLKDLPEWEIDRVMLWVEAVTHVRTYNRFNNAVASYDDTLLPKIQRTERIIFEDLGVDISSWWGLSSSLRKLIETNIEWFILVLETLVKYVRDNSDSSGQVSFSESTISSERALELLDHSLGNGSKWRVVHKEGAKAGLEERASEEMTNIAKNLSNSDLTDAWNYAYGMETDSKLAIEKAQNAIEYYASKYGLTKATSSVYGVMLSDIKVHPDKYESAAVQQFAEQDNALKEEDLLDGTLNNMMSNWFWHTLNLIQKTNVVRHKNGDNDGYVIPIEAARQAVLMATLICEFIEKGYFKKGNHRPVKS